MKKAQKNSIYLLMLFGVFLVFASSCKNTVTNSRDGNAYKTVTIGNQVWMAENLNVDKFRNGDLILQAKTEEEWKKAGENKHPAWCYFDNDTANDAKYGKLYNWYAVNDPRGLAPAGWHIPTDAEWKQLTDYTGEDNVNGAKMKSTNGRKDNGNGTNESGFTGLPGGYRSDDGRFNGVGKDGSWWSSTEYDILNAWARPLDNDPGNDYGYYGNKRSGISVRCVTNSKTGDIKSDSIVEIERRDTVMDIGSNIKMISVDSSLSDNKILQILGEHYKEFPEEFKNEKAPDAKPELEVIGKQFYTEDNITKVFVIIGVSNPNNEFHLVKGRCDAALLSKNNEVWSELSFSEDVGGACGFGKYGKVDTVKMFGINNICIGIYDFYMNQGEWFDNTSLVGIVNDKVIGIGRFSAGYTDEPSGRPEFTSNSVSYSFKKTDGEFYELILTKTNNVTKKVETKSYKFVDNHYDVIETER